MAGLHVVPIYRFMVTALYIFLLNQNTKRGEDKQKSQGFPWWSSGLESAFQCRDVGSNPEPVSKMPHVVDQLNLGATTPEPACSGARVSQLERRPHHAVKIVLQ